MKNMFEYASDNELLTYLDQCKEWARTGVIPRYKLGEIIREYKDIYPATYGTCVKMDLLVVIADRWENQMSGKPVRKGGYIMHCPKCGWELENK